MAQKARKRGRPRIETQSYVFEIKSWQPTYSLRLGQVRLNEGLYAEYLHVHFDGACIHPPALAGRMVEFVLMPKRNMLEPEIARRDPEWRPRCVGMLEMHPSRGHFYFSVPFDSLPYVMASYAQGAFRFISLYGPALKRGKSDCTSFHFEREVDFEEL